jgi:hypothetical protein
MLISGRVGHGTVRELLLPEAPSSEGLPGCVGRWVSGGAGSAVKSLPPVQTPSVQDRRWRDMIRPAFSLF